MLKLMRGLLNAESADQIPNHNIKIHKIYRRVSHHSPRRLCNRWESLPSYLVRSHVLDHHVVYAVCMLRFFFSPLFGHVPFVNGRSVQVQDHGSSKVATYNPQQIAAHHRPDPVKSVVSTSEMTSSSYRTSRVIRATWNEWDQPHFQTTSTHWCG
jgi:hypothetical protein